MPELAEPPWNSLTRRGRTGEIAARCAVMAGAVCLFLLACSGLYMSVVARSAGASQSTGEVRTHRITQGSGGIASLAFLNPEHTVAATLEVARTALSGMATGTVSENVLRSEYARHAIVDALSVSPLKSSLWLALAKLQQQTNPDDFRTAASLQMSYYTSSAISSLTPERLKFAVASNALETPDLRELARADIIALLLQRPDMSDAVTEAFASAPPAGRKFIERTVLDIQPSFLSRLR